MLFSDIRQHLFGIVCCRLGAIGEVFQLTPPRSKRGSSLTDCTIDRVATHPDCNNNHKDCQQGSPTSTNPADQGAKFAILGFIDFNFYFGLVLCAFGST